MIQRLTCILIILFLVGCQDVKRPEKPENLISQETMVSLLTEVYLGNAARSLNNKRIREQGVQLDSFLFAKFNIDSLQFVKSNAFYAADLDIYKEIVDSVKQRLENIKIQENDRKLKENTKKRAKKDTISNESIKNDELDTTKTNGDILVESVSSEQ